VRLDFLSRAIALAAENVETGRGGPFGAVIARGGEIVAEGVNLVTSTCDPSAHAEVTAIRNACRALSAFELTGLDLYSSCEPCPMCLGAIYWARLDRVYFAADRHDAAAAGFDDEFLYREFASGPDLRRVPLIRAGHEQSRYPFRQWRLKADKVPY
jgi:tRNA(Arg) A34 adenosine deaminase TadA